jgi:hypothetical protein
MIDPTRAQLSLQMLERDFAKYGAEERDEVEIIRDTLREMVLKHGSSAKLAILAASFEVAISLGQ